MTTFCSKCGVEIPANSAFCPSCGHPVAAVSPADSVPPPASYSPVPPTQPVQPAYTSAPPPVSSGGGALKIILIIVGVFVLLGVAAAGLVGFGIWRVSHALHVSTADHGGNVSMPAPSGTITAGSAASISASDLGAPIYPSALRGEGSLNLKTPNGSMVSAVFTTSDSVSQVADFYKSKFGDQASVIETGQTTMITSGPSDKEKTMVTISTDEGKTKIAIVHTTKD